MNILHNQGFTPSSFYMFLVSPPAAEPQGEPDHRAHPVGDRHQRRRRDAQVRAQQGRLHAGRLLGGGGDHAGEERLSFSRSDKGEGSHNCAKCV